MKSTLVHLLTGRHHSLHSLEEGSNPQAVESDPALTRWLEEHDIHTEFRDAGIGCCWFAQQGDREPVSGETEAKAIARLAWENGLQWREA
jgi:hypothetical protein